ncbi:MAG TPA: periplasmic heavy metal sensor [Gemmatimonadales bacterium]|nr:periplasmic heavy metal sensor [Gemmatimonadales bacterium]
MTETTRRPWKAAVLLAAVFLAGALLGGAVAPMLRPMGPTRDPGGMLTHMTKDLGLSPAQQDSIRAILERYRPAMDSAWNEVRPRIETVRARIRSDIAAQLTPEQHAKYDAMMKRHDEAHQAQTGRR